VRRRRAWALIVLGAGFAALVLVTSMPWSLLESQRHQLSTTAAELRDTKAQNRTLGDEAKDLSNPSTVANIARSEYGLVAPGSQAYDVLPAPGSSQDASVSTGHVPLDGPVVVPGSSESQALLGAGAAEPTETPSANGASSGSGAASRSSPSADPRTRSNRSAGSHSARPPASGGSAKGFWGRVGDTLEFWR
jgi:cell division protein FtsB